MSAPSWVPEGWTYVPSEPESRCDVCGQTKPALAGRLRREADGREWPLIGNNSKKQEREMVETIISAHPPLARDDCEFEYQVAPREDGRKFAVEYRESPHETWSALPRRFDTVQDAMAFIEEEEGNG